MPAQETFLDETIDGLRVQVIKTYDEAYAKDVFGAMSDPAKAFLWRSMKPEETYAPEDLPTEPGEDYDAFLLDELLEQGREDWKTFSYFVVTTDAEGPVFVAADWPTAEAFAKKSSVPDLPPRPLPRLDASGPQF